MGSAEASRSDRSTRDRLRGMGLPLCPGWTTLENWAQLGPHMDPACSVVGWPWLWRCLMLCMCLAYLLVQEALWLSLVSRK